MTTRPKNIAVWLTAISTSVIAVAFLAFAVAVINARMVGARNLDRVNKTLKERQERESRGEQLEPLTTESLLGR